MTFRDIGICEKEAGESLFEKLGSHENEENANKTAEDFKQWTIQNEIDQVRWQEDERKAQEEMKLKIRAKKEKRRLEEEARAREEELNRNTEL